MDLGLSSSREERGERGRGKGERDLFDPNTLYRPQMISKIFAIHMVTM